VTPHTSEPAAFIRAHLRLGPLPALPDIALYAAHPGSRLSRLAGAAPYWAYAWAGGLALARHFRAQPQLVANRRVLDLGAGSGLVGIVAASLGADVSAAEVDPYGRAAVGLNAAANHVCIALADIDIDGPAPDGFDLVAAGDVFYDADVALRMLPFLQRCQAAGIAVLVGDPERRDLPVAALERVASYAVGDVGDRAARKGTVYRLGISTPSPSAPAGPQQ
jgi:predicted nicotinamide N-methyase